MKRYIILLLVGLFSLIMLTGCDQRELNVPTNPSQVETKDAKRVLAFEIADNAKTKGNDYSIAMYSTETISEALQDDVVTVTLGDSVVTLIYSSTPPFFTGWKATGRYEIEDGEQIVLKINNQRKLTTTFDALCTVSVPFPLHYNYQQPLSLNWAVSHKNEYQFVRAGSYDIYVDGGDNTSSSFIKQISASRMNYLFPANCVSLCGDSLSTRFTIGVEEVNYKIIAKNAVMVYQYEYQTYSAIGNKSTKQQTKSRILELNNHLSHIQ